MVKNNRQRSVYATLWLSIILSVFVFTPSLVRADVIYETYFTIPDQYNGSVDIYLASENAATGTIVNGDGSFNANFSVPANGTTIVTIADSYRLTATNTVTDDGFVITSDNPVAAYLLDVNQPIATNDIAVLFPREGLSMSYRVMAYSGSQSQMAIVATEDNTTVTITPSVAVSGGHSAGTPFNVSLNRMQSVLYTGSDVTGSLIQSDKRVAVYGGNFCTVVPPNSSACDHLIEQMPGIDYWGTEYLLVPTKIRGVSPGDVMRVMAAEDGTVVNIDDGNDIASYNLDAGEYFSLQGPGYLGTISSLSSNYPVLVGQYMVGASKTGASLGDPAFSLVPPPNLWLSRYIFNVPTAYLENYVGIAIEADSLSSLTIDGEAPDISLDPIPGTTLVGGNVPVTAGQHIIQANSYFMLTMHGFDGNYASYFGIAGHRISGGGGVVIIGGLEITTTSLVDDPENPPPTGSDFTAYLMADGGTPPYTWAITSKAASDDVKLFPDYQTMLDNLSIANAEEGMMEGVTTDDGVLSWASLPALPENPNYYIDFTVEVTDDVGNTASATFRYTDPVETTSTSGSNGGGGGLWWPQLFLLTLALAAHKRRQLTR